MNLKVVDGMKELSAIDRLKQDSRYLEGLDWGKARIGHPEGTVRSHIEQLEKNLAVIADLLPPALMEPLRLLIHAHDSFKHVSGEKVPIENPKSHASLAAKFLEQYTDDPVTLKVAQHHDTLFACWCQHVYRGEVSQSRADKLLNSLPNHELLAAFILIDGLTDGKHSAPISWALERINANRPLPSYIEKAFKRLRLHARDAIEENSDCEPLVEEKVEWANRYRALGPIETWGADIYLRPANRPQIAPVLQELAERTGRSYAGVLHDDDGLLQVHLSRYPRRAGLPVASISSFRQGFCEVLEALDRAGVKTVAASESEAPAEGGLHRATIGLVEGYTETRKQALVKLIQTGRISGLTEARRMIEDQLGDLSAYGLDLSAARDVRHLAGILSRSLSKLHTLAEVEALAKGSAAVRGGNILSVAPAKYLYEEPCAVLIGKGYQARDVMFKVARTFAQARFTLEYLSARETVNVELPEFLGEKAAG